MCKLRLGRILFSHNIVLVNVCSPTNAIGVQCPAAHRTRQAAGVYATLGQSLNAERPRVTIDPSHTGSAAKACNLSLAAQLLQ